ncbi:MAG: MFS transporter [Lysobacterales bacterium]
MTLRDIPYWRLSAFYFAYFLALGAYAPYFAPYLESRGLSPWQISVVMSLWFGSRVYAPSTWGWLTARAAHPILWLRAGAAVTLAAFALFLLPLGFAAMVLVMLVYATAYNAIMPQFEALTLTHLGERRSRYGRIRVWGSVGFVIANIGFGWLLQRLGYHWLVALLLPVFALLLASTWINREADASAEESPSSGVHADLLSRLRSRAVWTFLTTALLMQLAHGAFYVFLSLHLMRNGYSAQQIGLLWAVGVMAEIAMFLWMPRVLGRFSPQTIMSACFGIGIVRWLVTALLPEHGWAIALSQMGHAFTFAAFHSTSIYAIGQFFPGRSGVHGQGMLYGFSSGLGGVLGALLAGALWELGGGRSSFLGAAVISMVGLALALRVRIPASSRL